MGGQGWYLWEAWRLEFGGKSTFVTPLGGGLWGGGLGFLAVNAWVLGEVVGDVGGMGRGKEVRGGEGGEGEVKGR